MPKIQPNRPYDEASLTSMREFADAMAEPLLLLDDDARILHANLAFCARSHETAEHLAGGMVFDLAGRRWDQPAFRTFLEQIRQGLSSPVEIDIEGDFGKLGRDGLRFLARSIHMPGGGKPFLLLAIRELEGHRNLLTPSRDQIEIETDLRERERNQAALLELGDSLRDQKIPQQMTASALELLVRTLGVIRAGYARFEADQDNLTVEGDWCRAGVRSLMGRYRIGDYGSDGGRLRRGETGVIEDSQTDSFTRSEADRWQALGVAAALHVPLVEGGRLTALFFVHDDNPRSWTKREVDFARKVADRTWAAIERVRAEQEREESLAALVNERAKLTAIIEKAPAFICILRGDRHVFELANRHYYELVGRRELIGKTVLEALPEIDGQGFYERLDVCYARDESSSGKEIPVIIRRRADGPLERRFLNFVYQPIHDAHGSVEGIFVHGVDVTEMVEAREAVAAARDDAEAANRMKDEFLATLSHELRTPLNAIVGWSRVLLTGKTSPSDLHEGLAAIQRNAHAQSQLIEDLLDISRIVTGNLKLEVREINPDEVIEAAFASVMHSASVKEIRVERHLDPLAGPIRGDFARLQQVVWNLLSNAIKFSPKGGSIRVRLERVHSRVEISVSDDGIGIEPEFLPYVFDRFRQADGSTTRRHNGLGLGLSIVRKLIELHGGEVRVQSPGRGQGATFVVTLPIPAVQLGLELSESSNPDGSSQAGDVGLPATLAGVRVLVLDDEPDARLIIHRILTGSGAEVALAASVDEAEAVLDDFRPDVLVSDISMPDRDGYEFIRLVRTRHSSRTLPAAALTAFARAEDRRRALLAGFQTHIAKPVEPEELVAVVAGLAGKTDAG